MFPFNQTSISDKDVAPAVIYAGKPALSQTPVNVPPSNITDSHILEATLQLNATSPTITDNHEQSSNSVHAGFFASRTIAKALVKKPKTQVCAPFISGSLNKQANIEVMESAAKTVKVACDVKSKKQAEPKPSTSGVNTFGGAIHTLSEDDENVTLDTDNDDLCCVCSDWQPKELRGCDTIVFVTWGKCDFCPHWTHLKYCSEVRVLRRDSIFRCPHCADRN